MLHQVSVKLTTMATITKNPLTQYIAMKRETYTDFLRLPDVIVMSHPRLNDSPLYCVTFRS